MQTDQATTDAAAALALCANNDHTDYRNIVYAVKQLRGTLDRTAYRLAKANAAWHDDPSADDHAAHHLPPEEQFPRAARDQAIIDLVTCYLAEMH